MARDSSSSRHQPVGRAGDREKALDQALATIEKNFGKGSVMRLGDESRPPVEVIPTGAIAYELRAQDEGAPTRRLTVEPIAWSPVLLVAPDGREARFPRAMARFRDLDTGDAGLGWLEFGQPPPPPSA